MTSKYLGTWADFEVGNHMLRKRRKIRNLSLSAPGEHYYNILWLLASVCTCVCACTKDKGRCWPLEVFLDCSSYLFVYLLIVSHWTRSSLFPLGRLPSELLRSTVFVPSWGTGTRHHTQLLHGTGARGLVLAVTRETISSAPSVFLFPVVAGNRALLCSWGWLRLVATCLPLPPECWVCKHTPQHLALDFLD